MCGDPKFTACEMRESLRVYNVFEKLPIIFGVGRALSWNKQGPGWEQSRQWLSYRDTFYTPNH